MSDDYLWDKSGEPDPAVQRLEAKLSPLAYAPPAQAPVQRPGGRVVRARSRWVVRVAFAMAAALAALAVVIWGRKPPRALEARHLRAPTLTIPAEPTPQQPAFEVTRLGGAPVCGSQTIDDKGAIGVGQWLETDGHSSARIAVASIGSVEVAPGSRVRLAASGPKEHRLDLERGRIDAKVDAPPRLFIVGTPSATAVDLGCAYSLEVDPRGGAMLRVSSGYVSLEWKKKKSLVPAGAECATRPGVGPGTPAFTDASPALKKALAEFDFERGGEAAVRTVLKAARVRDSLTLWHLLFRVEVPLRKVVYERLVVLLPPPPGVGEPEAVELDRDKLQPWKERMRATW